MIDSLNLLCLNNLYIIAYLTYILNIVGFNYLYAYVEGEPNKHKIKYVVIIKRGENVIPNYLRF